MRGGGGFSLECQVKVFKCVVFFKKKKTPQRIKETNQLETEKKVIHEISSFYAVKWC